MAVRKVLVTAGSRGLGFAIARSLARDGAELAICGRERDALDSAVAALRDVPDCPGAHGIVADLSERESVDALWDSALEALGTLDCLVVNSGHMAYGALESLPDADWDQSYEMLLMSAVRLARAAVGHMKAGDRGGDIVFVTSAGVHETTEHLLLSSVMRAGIGVLAKHLATALTGTGIRVNVVAPGYFDTGRVRNRIDALMTEENLDRNAAILRIANANPMGRIGVAEELGELVSFVVGSRARFLNGTTLVVDGGRSRLVT